MCWCVTALSPDPLASIAVLCTGGGRSAWRKSGIYSTHPLSSCWHSDSVCWG